MENQKQIHTIYVKSLMKRETMNLQSWWFSQRTNLMSMPKYIFGLLWQSASINPKNKTKISKNTFLSWMFKVNLILNLKVCHFNLAFIHCKKTKMLKKWKANSNFDNTQGWFIWLKIFKLWVQYSIQILPVFTWRVPKDTRKLVFFGTFQTKTDKLWTFRVWVIKNYWLTVQ